jgi:hypothetical protein
MWARNCEILLSFWLYLCYFIFPESGWMDPACGTLVLLFALLSYIPSLNKMHLLQVLPAGWLLFVAYSYPTPLLPFALQNDILTALTLLMFALIPTHATEPPRPWQKFRERGSRER